MSNVDTSKVCLVLDVLSPLLSVSVVNLWTKWTRE